MTEIDVDNYITLTSFLHQPFNTEFVLNIPDNFSNGTFYNLPLNDLVSATDEALKKGYTLALDCDVSEQTFSSKYGVAVIPKLIDNNVAVIFCDDKHMPNSMLLNLDNHHIQQELFTHQINATEPLKKQLWQQIIKHKINNQATHLIRRYKPQNPLKYYANKVLSGDTTNREAVAASYYWKNIFDFDFKRERSGKYPNLFLNYGYIVLRAAVARALAGSGLLSTLGIHHHNKYNAFCLADDIMEPYRPLVDAKVIEIINTFNEKWFKGWSSTPEEKRVKLITLKENIVAHKDFEDKVANNPDLQNKDIALKKIMDEILRKQRKIDLELYKLSAQDSAFYQSLFDTMKRVTATK